MWHEIARFCPVCGTPLVHEQVDDRQRPLCRACGLTIYGTPSPAAATVVLDDERQVLLIKRRRAPFEQHWTLPAGYQEYDEDPVRTALRETEEETGLCVVIDGLIDVLYTSDDPRKRGILVVYLAHPVGGTLRAGDDAEDAAFFPVHDLPSPVGFANDRRVLAHVASELAAGRLPGDGRPRRPE
ncbi:MAG: NUDIX hydrolase [Planctomycetota bacterium]